MTIYDGPDVIGVYLSTAIGDIAIPDNSIGNGYNSGLKIDSNDCIKIGNFINNIMILSTNFTNADKISLQYNNDGTKIKLSYISSVDGSSYAGAFQIVPINTPIVLSVDNYSYMVVNRIDETFTTKIQEYNISTRYNGVISGGSDETSSIKYNSVFIRNDNIYDCTNIIIGLLPVSNIFPNDIVEVISQNEIKTDMVLDTQYPNTFIAKIRNTRYIAKSKYLGSSIVILGDIIDGTSITINVSDSIQLYPNNFLAIETPTNGKISAASSITSYTPNFITHTKLAAGEELGIHTKRFASFPTYFGKCVLYISYTYRDIAYQKIFTENFRYKTSDNEFYRIYYTIGVK